MNKPKRACVLEITIETHTREGMIDALNEVADKISMGIMSTGCWGGTSSSATYRYIERDSPTKDDYFKQLREYLSIKDSEKEQGQ